VTQGDPKKVELCRRQLFRKSAGVIVPSFLTREGPFRFMLSKHYIVGLIDGEGSFTLYIRAPQIEHQAKSWRVECHFYVKMGKQELPLLQEVKDFFGCGRVSLQRDKRPNHRDCYRFEISNLKEIKSIVIPFFKKNPLHGTSRKNDFELFCKIIDLVNKKAHQNKKGLKKVLKMKAQMHR